jgi:cation diffusion facilitator family transporter
MLAAASIAIAILVLALKYLAYRMTGSIALFSDALESVVNVVTAMVALIAVRTSAKPADSNHPYGHDKAEYISTVLEGVLIVVAAMAILREAYSGVIAPRPLDAPWQGLLVNAMAGVINGLWCWLLIRQGRRHRSPALVADGYHLFTDVMTSVGVLGGLLLATVTGWAVLDPILAGLVALNILWSGWRMLKESVAGLMDEAPPAETLCRIRELISANADGAIEAHDLRTRHAGRRTFIEFHLVVPGDLSVAEAHEICDRIEHAVKADMGEALITIHIEPEEKAKHSGIVVL